MALSVSGCCVRRGKGFGRGDIRVDVINANEVVLDEDFALFWSRNWQVGLVFKNLDTSSLLNENPFHGLRDRGRHCACCDLRI